jgi:uncharacterized protein Usg
LNVFLFGALGSCIVFSGWLEVGMIEKDAVSKDFRSQVLGYGLTTAEIVYRRPDRHWLLQTYVWQEYDLFSNFPALEDFLAFWETRLEGPLFDNSRAFQTDQACRIACCGRSLPFTLGEDGRGDFGVLARTPARLEICDYRRNRHSANIGS